jgi:cytoskeletal protein CcmA (bactofilin family)
MRRCGLKTTAAALLLWGCGLLPHLQAGETWDLSGKSVHHTDTETNDLFLLSDEARLEGIYEEDVWVAGRQVRFTGEAKNDLRLAGLEVLTVEGPVRGDLSAVAWAGNMLISTNAVVEGAATLQGNKRITVSGRFGGDVQISAPNVVVEAEIDGTLTVDAPEIRILPGTRIGGDLVSTGERDLQLARGVTLEGEQRQVASASTTLEDTLNQWMWLLKAAQILSALLVGLLLLRLVPRFMGRSVDLLITHRGACMGVGSITLLVGGAAGLLFLSTFYAGGTGIFLLTVTGLLFYMGKIVAALALGAFLLRSSDGFSFGRLSLAYLLGLLTLSLLFSVAIIGPPLYILTSLWGMGSLVLAIRQSQQVLHAEIPPHLQAPESPSNEDPS